MFKRKEKLYKRIRRILLLHGDLQGISNDLSFDDLFSIFASLKVPLDIVLLSCYAEIAHKNRKR